MERFQGKLSEGDLVLLQKVEGLIEQKPGPSSEWEGHFRLPESSIGPVHVGKTYRLELEKGMSLNIVLNKIRHRAGADPIAEFHSTGNPSK
jgi:hypothetical protein